MKLISVLLAFIGVSVLELGWCHQVAAQQGRLGRGMNVVSSISASELAELGNQLHPSLIRYTLSLGTFADTASVESYHAEILKALDRFDNELVPVLRSYGMKVVLSLGTPPGGFASRRPPLPQMRIFTKAPFQIALKDLWNELSLRYASSDVVVAYHLLSEPAIGAKTASGLLSWYDLQAVLGAIVRKNDKRHPIVLTSEYSNPFVISRAQVKNLRNVWYAVNFYMPVDFLRQGVELPVNTMDYPSKKYNKKYLERLLRPTVRFSKLNKSKILVTEFTTSRFGPAGSSVRYLADLLDVFSKHRWNWTFHAWAEADAWDVRIPAAEDTASSKLPYRARLLKQYFSFDTVRYTPQKFVRR